jgi:hypothetical protein
MMLSVNPGFHVHGQNNVTVDSVDEGTPYSVTFSFDNPIGPEAIEKFTINWKDGTVQDIAPTATGATHTYTAAYVPDPVSGITNNYFIDATVTLADHSVWHDEGDASFNTLLVSVNDVAFPSISGAASVNEGSTYTLNLAVTDPGTEPAYLWQVIWNYDEVLADPINAVPQMDNYFGSPSSVTHVYDDNAASHLIVALYGDATTDFDGNTVLAGAFQATPLSGLAVTINDVAPTAAFGSGGAVNEGSAANVSFSGQIDPSAADTAAGFHYAYDLNNDGTFDVGDGTYGGSGTSATATVPASYLVDGPGSFAIKGRIIDKDGGFTDYTTNVVVNNVAPTLTLSGAASVNEGSVYTLGLSSFDPGTDTISSWKINWGDSTQIVSGNPASVTHTYANGANPFTAYTISATATDEDGTYAAGNTVSMHVLNVAPTGNAGGPYSTFDDTSITLTGTAIDPGTADSLTYAWDLDNNGSFETPGASVIFNPVTLGFSGNQTRTVNLKVSDGDGGVSTVSTTVQLLGQGTVLSGGVLYVVGSGTGGDIVQIGQSGSQITVSNGGTQSFSAAAVTQIQIRTRGGNDVVIVGLNVTTPAVIDGGAGNDLLTAGGGDSVLLGGTGNDILIGGPGNNVLVGGDGTDILIGAGGRDLMIGGKGSDLLTGGTGEDILIGGYTTYDANVASLDAIMAVWASGASFSARVATLTGTGGLLKAGVTVLDDDARDVMDGGAGRDLYFANIDPHDPGRDLVALQQSLDSLVAVN